MSYMEKKNTLDEKFINLRSVFHDFQTSVRFSTCNSSSQIFANQLKSYEFLGQLQEHFIAQKVQYLYEFVHSIFSLIFTMIRESPNQRSQKTEDKKKFITIGTGTQTEQSYCEDKKKTFTQNYVVPFTRHKKRAGLQIQIFEKDLNEMSIRERRRALQKMRDMIDAEDEPMNEHSRFLKDFKPNVEKISYSKSDQSIKATIDTFKESDISTHIFLKDFMEELVEVKDVKSYPELLSKDLIQSMANAITKYKQIRYQGKAKCRIFSHIIEEIIHPAVNQSEYQMKINLTIGNQKNKPIKKEEAQQRPKTLLMNQESNFSIQKTKISDLNAKQNIKRSRFPSLIGRNKEDLNPISQTKSYQTAGSSMSQISSKSRNKKPMIKKLKSSFSQEEFSSSLGRFSQKRNRASNLMPSFLEKNNSSAFMNPRESIRFEDVEKENNQLVEKEKQKLKEKQLLKSKKLSKRNISNFIDRQQDRAYRNSELFRKK